MYTVEMDHDEICITVLDDVGFNDDLRIIIYDDIVFITQHDPENDQDSIIQISPDMWDELISAINSPEGAFRIKKVDNTK